MSASKHPLPLPKESKESKEAVEWSYSDSEPEEEKKARIAQTLADLGQEPPADDESVDIKQHPPTDAQCDVARRVLDTVQWGEDMPCLRQMKMLAQGISEQKVAQVAGALVSNGLLLSNVR